MDQVIRTTAPRLHPLLIAAAVSVIALSATGIAAFTGVLPAHRADTTTSMDTPAPVASIPTNTVVIQNSTTTAEPATATADPLDAVEPAQPKPVVKAAPKVIRTKTAASTKPAIVADASGPAYHPTAVSATSSELPISDGTPMPPAPAISQMQPPPVCAYCGTVEGVREIKQQGQGSGLGAVAGGVGGAVLGKQFGNGRGSTALAVLGAVGGALAGHEVEKQVRSSTVFEVTVRMEDGSMRTITQANPPPWRNGERVRVDGNTLSIL